ncbi:MAG: fused MFS/spermidine synthase, partial [Thermoanaerobaculia bacterium]|nr:fused MFS/spermidine synthase [Thermoanaerobaculia bacterium]
MSADGRIRRIVLILCFLLSGAASLMDQVVWLRYLGLSFGNTTWAAATLLAVFMGGLGLGALWIGRWSDRWRRPLLWYAVFEVAVALFALASPRLLGLLDVAYVALYRSFGQQLWPFALGRAALAALFLLPPTVMMGGTLPLVLRSALRKEDRVGRLTALLYGMNTVGAVGGTALAGFLSIRVLGLYGTLVLAAGANLLAALGAVAISRPMGAVAHPARKPVLPWLKSLFFLMGATSLAYEVLWTRILVFYLGSSVYAYSIMLALVLTGIGVGSLLISPWADRLSRPLLGLGLLELLLGLWIPIQVGTIERLNRILVEAVELVEPGSYWGVAGSQLLATAVVLGPPTLLMGASFPLAVRAAHRDLDRIGQEIGAVYGWNTLGAVVGSFGAGFLLIPWLGTQNALLSVGMINALLAAWILGRARVGSWNRVLWVAPALVLAAGMLFPADAVILSAGIFRHDESRNLVYFHEDAQASVTIRELTTGDGGEPYLSLELNGVNVAGTSPDLFAVQKMQGHLPLLLTEEPTDVVHIGFGSGGTAWAVSRHPVEEILIVEISPQVLAASDRFFPDINHGVLDDPRVEVEINDGRNFVLASQR